MGIANSVRFFPSIHSSLRSTTQHTCLPNFVFTVCLCYRLALWLYLKLSTYITNTVIQIHPAMMMSFLHITCLKTTLLKHKTGIKFTQVMYDLCLKSTCLLWYTASTFQLCQLSLSYAYFKHVDEKLLVQFLFKLWHNALFYIWVWNQHITFN